MINLEHVSKLYGTVLGVNDVCLDLPPGGHGLVGPNGSGKTTLLHLLMGLLRPTLGSLRVFGQDPERHKAILRRIGYCPSLDGLYGTVTGFQWVRYLLELHGVPRLAAAEKSESLLEQVGLSGAMHRAMGTYSRGMRQRVKLAQAVAHEPELLILDEPFNGLDPIARHDITVWLREWIASGKSLILASHVLHEVESVTSSFLLICGGRVLASGEAHEIHRLLADVPNDVRFQSGKRERLASVLIERGLADAVRMGDAPDDVVVSTRQPAELFRQLPLLAEEHDLELRCVESQDDSLQALFDKLFRVHRGEL